MQPLLAVFSSRRMLAVLLLGFSSGLPLLLIGKTLQARLTPAGIDLKTLGFVSLISLPYSLKVLWAPFVDRYAIPPGRRRGWLFATQAALVLGLAAMAWQDPADGLGLLVANAVLVAVFSATQDLVIDAWRIENVDEHELGAAAGTAALGYRLAMGLTGGLALVAAGQVSWTVIYLALAAVQAACLLATWRAPERPSSGAPRSLDAAVWRPLADFAQRFGGMRLAWIVAFLLLYRLGEFLAFNMAMPFLLKAGYGEEAIGWVQGVGGMLISLAGTILGGAAIVRIGAARGLLLFGILQGISNLAYWWLASHGGGLGALIAVTAIEHLCYGLATAAFVAWMMALCSPRYAATQFALLSALMAVSRDALASMAGQLAEMLGWPGFFLLAVALALPGLAILPLAVRRPPPSPAPA